MYRDDRTAAEARIQELEHRLEGARQETARLQQLTASRPSPWSGVAKVWMGVAVILVVLGVVYMREMSRHADARPLGPRVGRAPSANGGL
jgi:hypothetical protein